MEEFERIDDNDAAMLPQLNALLDPVFGTLAISTDV